MLAAAQGRPSTLRAPKPWDRTLENVQGAGEGRGSPPCDAVTLTQHGGTASMPPCRVRSKAWYLFPDLRCQSLQYRSALGGTSFAYGYPGVPLAMLVSLSWPHLEREFSVRSQEVIWGQGRDKQ